MKHYSNPTSSDRCQRVLTVLRSRRSRGATTLELGRIAMVTDVKDVIHELRKPRPSRGWNGIPIASVIEEQPSGRRCARYWLPEYAPEEAA